MWAIALAWVLNLVVIAYLWCVRRHDPVRRRLYWSAVLLVAPVLGPLLCAATYGGAPPRRPFPKDHDGVMTSGERDAARAALQLRIPGFGG